MSKKRGINLDDLAKGKLPDKVLKSIGKTEMTVNDLYQWQDSHPPFYIAFKKGILFFDLRIRWSLKKLLAIAGGLISLVWAIMTFGFDYLPKIREWLSKL